MATIVANLPLPILIHGAKPSFKPTLFPLSALPVISPAPVSSSPEFHPALTVTNIRNAIPLMLDTVKVQYSNWSELFENHALAYDVLDHIDPKTPRPSGLSDHLWNRLDAVVKQWIYGTISPELVQTILFKGSTAQQTWDRLKNLFQNNKNNRALHLDNQFTTIHLSNFPNITSYCQQLKSLSDQLANVDQPVTEQKLVLRLCAGLRETDYDTVATMIQQTEPLPDFFTARSKLLIEESRRAETHHPPSAQSYHTEHTTASPSAQSSQQQQPSSGAPSSRGGGRGGRGGRAGWRGGRGYRGGRGGRGGYHNNNNRHNPNPPSQNWTPPPNPLYNTTWAPTVQPNNPWQSPHYGQWPAASWTPPPAPFPTSSQPNRNQQGILGHAPRPTAAQAFYGSDHGPIMTPTELGNAFATMSFPQHDPTWYMDSGASSHMTNNAERQGRVGVTVRASSDGSDSSTSLSIIESVQNVWDKPEDRIAVIGLGFTAIIAFWASLNLVSAIDKLPLLPGFFEFVGILFSSWFVYRNLLFKPDREQLFRNINQSVSNILGQ